MEIDDYNNKYIVEVREPQNGVYISTILKEGEDKKVFKSIRSYIAKHSCMII